MRFCGGNDNQTQGEQDDIDMSASISQSELALLKYLHEHSGQSGERIWLDPKPIIQSLHITMTQLAENSASLGAHGFAGVRDFRPDANNVPSSKCSAIWITRKGEDYLRALQSGPFSARISKHP
jgi:hypothetical protein